jgi:type II secretory pathway pseudopilin PulG
MNLRNQALGPVHGYAMAALLVALGVMAVAMTVALPTWRQMVQREKEDELIFRGQQYVRAISLFQRKYAASFPPNIDTLVTQRFLRKKYKDPMTADGEFQILYQMSLQQQPGQAGQPGRGGPGAQGRGASPARVPPTPQQPGGTSFGGNASLGGGTLGPRGGMIGVASKSTDTSVRLYNGRDHYNEWQFVFVASMMPGAARPGAGGRGGRGGMGPGMGGPGMGGRGGMGPGMGGRGMGPGGGPGRGFQPGGPGGQPYPGGRGPG